MADTIDALIKATLDTSSLDAAFKKWEREMGFDLPGVPQTKMEQGIRDKATKDAQAVEKKIIKEKEKAAKDAIKESARIERERIKANADVIKSLNKDKSEQEKTFEDVEKSLKPTEEKKKEIGLYKEWRKVLTGVLIDLHWFRILASQSKVLGANFQIMGRVTGYLLDVILLPMMPALLSFSMAIIGIANFISRLPKGFKLLLAGIVGMILAITVSATAITMTFGMLMKANESLAGFSVALDLLSVKIAMMTGTPAMGGGALLGGAMAGLGIGLLVVYLMAITGVLGKIYDFGVGTRKWLDKSLALPLNFIRQLLTIIVSIAKFIWDILKTAFALPETLPKPEEVATPLIGGIIDIAGIILKWLIDTLNNIIDLGIKIVLGISCDYQDIGKQSAEIALKILKGENPQDLKISVPRKIKFYINKNVADLLGITIPDVIIKKASEVF